MWQPPGKIKAYKLEVYSGESVYISDFKRSSNVVYCGKVPYSRVQKNFQCDIVVVVEGFGPENVDFTRYSCYEGSNSLASGAAFLLTGLKDAGVIERG